MEKDRSLDILAVTQELSQTPDVVSVHRAQIGKAHVLKEAARQQGILDRLFDLVGDAVDGLAAGEDPHGPAVALFELEILGPQPLAGQMLGHAAHALGDGHAVVVEDDDHPLAAVPRVG